MTIKIIVVLLLSKKIWFTFRSLWILRHSAVLSSASMPATLLNPFQTDTLTKVMTGWQHVGSKVTGQKMLYILCSRSTMVWLESTKHTYTMLKLIHQMMGKDTSKMAANSKSHAIFHTAYDWSQGYSCCLGDGIWCESVNWLYSTEGDADISTYFSVSGIFSTTAEPVLAFQFPEMEVRLWENHAMRIGYTIFQIT